jgi:pyruvate dehydrogenase E2 component (dihydrolipoyllysine-residue acetyltransferase)
VTVVDVGMPKLSDSMEEATVLRWLKDAGEDVRRGEPLVEVETDKATVVYEAESDGVLESILVAEGESAVLGAPIARLRTEAGARAAVAAPAPARASAPAAGRARATPVARRRAAQLGVALDGVAGSGPQGRIVASDVEAATPAGAAPAVSDGDPRGAMSAVSQTATQKTIAQRMSDSRAEIPDFTLEAEIDMEGAARLREDLRAGGVEPLPSFNDLVVRAVALALREFPALNAAYEPGRVLRFARINVGVAVDAGDALLVPVVRDADRRPLTEIAAESARLAERARTRSLGPDDLAGGTFTVSNLGMFGIRRFHAVIDRPQAAILAVGSVAPRPVVAADGSLVARRTMDVALSCDHRVVYGAEAARFLARVRELLEHPTLLLLEAAP